MNTAPRALADLPIVAEGIRARLLQRELYALRLSHRILFDALRDIAAGDSEHARRARAALLRASRK